MSKSTRNHRRPAKAPAKVHAAPGSTALPLRRTWPLSLCIGLVLGSVVVSGDALAGGPTGGKVVGGSGTITQAGNSTVINQASKKLALNWNTFNVAANESVLFNQPSRTAVALNRILDQNPSQIFGRINSNGQVFLINTHGIIFGATAQLNVGGLLASTLDLTPNDFLAGHYDLNLTGARAGIVNHGLIQAASGGSVSLVGGSVANDGLIFANYGKINLDGADHAVLDFDGNGLINIQVTGELKERLENREAAVSNQGTLRAEDGTVVLQASAAKDLFTNLVNNSGVIDASGISTDGGVVRLVARGGNTVSSGSIDATGVHGGSVQLLSDRNVGVSGSVDASGTRGGGSIRVGGGQRGGEGLLTAANSTLGAGATLAADATQSGNGGSVAVWGDQTTTVAGSISARGGAQGGDGGSVETSAAHVHIADGTRVTTLAPRGQSGNWLIDPKDYTIAASGGDMTGATLSSNLAGGDITIESSNGGANGSGNINVNDAVGWNAHTLTLTAADNINVNAAMTAGGNAGLVLNTGTANGSDSAVAGGVVNAMPGAGRVDFTGGGNSLSINGHSYTLISSASALQGIGATGYYAIAGDIDASGIGNFTPIGQFNGILEGLGHTVSHLNINSSAAVAGLFGYLYGTVANLGLVDGHLAADTGTSGAGLLAGVSAGDVRNVYATGSVTATRDNALVGGLVGDNESTIRNAYADVAVTASGAGAIAGGLVGMNDGYHSSNSAPIVNAYATGKVTGSANGTIGGLVGLNQDGQIQSTYATGAVSGSSTAGGLVGYNNSGTIVDSYWDTQTTGRAASSGGTGRTTAQLQAALPGGFSSSTWALAPGGSYPYLLSQFAAGVTPVAVSGTVYTNAGTTAAGAGVTVNAMSGGSALGTTDTHANGYFYYLFDPSALTGNNLLVYAKNYGSGGTTNGVAFADGFGTLPVLDIFGNAFHVQTGATHWSTVLADLAGAEGGGATAATALANLPAGGLANLVLGAQGAFGFDGGLNWTGDLVVTTGGDLTQSSGDLAVTGTSNFDAGSHAITLTSTGNDFGGAVSLSGGTTQITDKNALTLGVLATGALTATSTGALGLGHGSVGGNLVADSHGGAIGQAGGGLVVTGTSSIDAGTGAITLADADNDFGGAVSLSGGTTQITDKNALTLGTLATGALTATSTGALNLGQGSVGGNLVAGSHGGAIGQAGGLAVTGTGSIDAGTGAITLADAGNDFGGVVSLSGGTTQITDKNALTLGTLATGALTATSTGALGLGHGSVGGKLTATSHGGAITEGSGGLLVSGASDLQAGSGAITLTDGGNHFGGAVTAAGHGVSLKDAGDLTIASLDGGTNGAVNLTAGGSLYLPASAIDTGTASLTLVSNGGLLSTSGALSGANLTLVGRNGITLGGDLSSSGVLTLTSSQGSITQAGGVLAAGTLTGSSLGGTTLGQANLIDTLGDFTASGFSLTNAQSLTVSGTVNGGGTASISTGGNLVLDGGISGTTTTLDAGGTISQTGGAITATTLNLSSIGGASLLQANHVANLGTVSNTGGGGLSFANAGALNLSGAVNVGTAGGNDVNLDVNGGLTQSGGSVITADRLGGSVTGNATLGGANLLDTLGSFSAANLSLTNAQTLTVSGPLSMPSTLSLTTTAGDLNLSTSLAATTVGLDAAAALTLANDIAADSLSLRAGGAISQTGGALAVTGGTTVDANGHAITLTGTDNDFGGTVNLSGGATQIADSNALTLGTLATGALTATSHGALNLGHGAVASLDAASNGGAITQAGPLAVGGDSHLDAGAGSITLGQANSFTGAIDAAGKGIEIAGTGNLVFSGLHALANGNVKLTAGGVLDVSAAGAIDTGTGDLTLASNGGSLAMGGALAGTNVSLLSDGDLDLQHDVTAHGSLSLTSTHGAISQTAGLVAVDGATTLSAADDIGLNNLNVFTGKVTVAHGADVSLAASGPLGMGTVTADSLALSAGSITLNEDIATTGAQVYDGAVRLNGATGGVTLTGNGVSFTGTVDNASSAAPQALTVNQGSGYARFDGAVGGGNGALGALTMLGGGQAQFYDGVQAASFATAGGTLLYGDVTTHGAQTYGGQLSLANGVALRSNGGDVRFQGDVTSLAPATALTVDAGSGDVTFDAAVGATAQPLGNLAVSGDAVSFTGAVRVAKLETQSGTFSANVLDVGAGGLSVTTTGGDITQGGAFTVAGASRFDAGTHAITLADTANSFGGPVDLTGGATRITGTGTLTLGNLSTGALTAVSAGALNLGSGAVGGVLDATAGGDITQGGALAVTGASRFDAGTHAITLADTANSFGGPVDLTGGATQIASTGSLTLGTLATGALAATSGGSLNLGGGTVGGTLEATAAGDIVQAGALDVLGASTFTVLGGAHDILLNTQANDFHGQAVTLEATGGGSIGTFGLKDTSPNALFPLLNAVPTNLALDYTQAAIVLPGFALAGYLDLTAGGGITFDGDVTTGGAQGYHGAVLLGSDVTLTTTDHAVTLDGTVDNATATARSLTIDAGDGVVTFGGATGGGTYGGLGGLTVRGGAFDAKALNIAGDLAVTSVGAITQGGAFTVTGSSSFDAGANAITLTDADNDFGGAVNLTGGTTQIADKNALTLGTLSTGALTATSHGALNLGTGTVASLDATSNGGAIGQAGALGVTGTSTIDAGSGAITLTNTDNDFAGAVNLTGGTTQITDKNALTLGTLNTGALTAISQGALNLGTGTVASLDATSNGGAIGQAGALHVNGTSAIDAGSGAITLANTSNDFAGAVNLTGGTTQITDKNALTLGTLSTGALTAISHGALNLGTGTVASLRATSDNNAITQSGALGVTGASTINAGSSTITLANTGNDFAGAVNLTGGTTQITDKNALTLGTLATGALTAISHGALDLGTGTVASLDATSNDGAITQAGALDVTGASTINAGSGAITLTNTGNDFAGAVNLTGGMTQITDKNALTLGTLATGALTAISHGALNLGTGTVASLDATSNGGAIGQAGALDVTGASTINAGSGAITLTNTGNDFAGAVNLTGGTTQITDKNALTLGTLNTGALTATSHGALNLGSGTVASLDATSNGGAIGQAGALGVTGASTINAGSGAITLANTGNDFAGAVSLTGGTTQITDKNALTLGTLSTGALTATSHGALNLGSGTVASLDAASNGGAIGQAGALHVNGASAIDAGSGAITLTNTGNDFVGAMTLAGTGMSVVDANDLVIASLANGANGAVSLIAGGTLSLPGGAIDTGTSDLLLASRGGSLATPGALSGANVSLEGRDGVALNNDVTTPGVLHVVSGAGIGQGGGVITAGTLTGSSAGDTVLDGANRIGTLGAFSAANFALTNAQTLTVSGPLDTSGDIRLVTTAGELIVGVALAGDHVTLDSADDLALNQDVDGNAVQLSSDGNISQNAGIVTAGTLGGHAAGSVALDRANRVDALGPFDAGSGFGFTNAQALTVDGAVSGGTGAARIATTAGGLTVNAGVTGASVDLGGHDGLAIRAAIDSGAGTTALKSAAGAITESAAGRVTAGLLTGQSAGGTTLGGANRIDALGAFSAAGFSLTNAQSLAVTGPLDGGASVKLVTTSGDLALDGAVKGTATVLDAAGAISEGAGGGITAATLSGQSVGATALDGANHVGALGKFTAAGFSLTNAQSLAVNGPLDGGSSTKLTTTSGDLAINGAVSGTSTSLRSAGAISEGAGGSIAATTLSGQSAGATTLDGANHVGTLGKFTAAGFSLTNAQSLAVNGPLDGGGSTKLATTSGDLAINGAVRGTATSLRSAGAISEGAGGSIAATTLSGQSAGATTLDGANHVGTLGKFTAAGFSLTNAQSLAVNGPLDGGSSTKLTTTSGNLAINGAVRGTATTLRSAGAISEGAGGSITAATLSGQSGGATHLDRANHVGTLGGFTAAGFSLANAQSLTVRGPLDGGASTALRTTSGDLAIDGAVSGTSTTLDAAGKITEGANGSIAAATLNGRSGGATRLDGGNRIGTLGGFDAAGFSLTNAQSLAVSGPVNGGASTAFTTTKGDLSIDGEVRGATTTLTSAGAIGEGSDGNIVAGTLNGRSGGATTLDGNNHIGTVGRFTAASFGLTNAQSLTIGGPLDGGTRTTLTTTSGDLAIAGAVSGATTVLDAAGAISQGAAGSITATSLSGRSAGATRLDGANHVGTLGRFDAAGFGLTNAQGLVVSGPVNGGAEVALTTTAGDLAINGAVSGATTTLKSAGSIGEGAGGSIAAATLTGQSGGATRLDGANRIDTLGAFSAAGFSLTNAQSLAIGGAVNGGASTLLTTTSGNLAINGAVSGGTVRLVSAGTITEGTGGAITAGTLSGQAAGATMLGDATHKFANMVDTLGNFSSTAGFSLTNAKTLTLASVDGSAFTVDAGTSATYLSVTNGDLFQRGTTWLYNGSGTWDSTGRIGTASAPIYVTGVSMQTVSFVGLPPAYFYAVDRSGNLLPLGGGFAINVPTASGAGSAQNGNHGNSYIDPAVITANYRSYGIVPSGVRLPADQNAGCDPDDPDQVDCDDGDSLGMLLNYHR